MNFHFNLPGRPDSTGLAQTEGRELFDGVRPFQRFLHVNGIAGRVVEPRLNLGVMRTVRRARCALQHIAIMRAKLGALEKGLVLPVILRLKKILIVEVAVIDALTPFVKRQGRRC